MSIHQIGMPKRITNARTICNVVQLQKKKKKMPRHLGQLGHPAKIVWIDLVPNAKLKVQIDINLKLG